MFWQPRGPLRPLPTQPLIQNLTGPYRPIVCGSLIHLTHENVWLKQIYHPEIACIYLHDNAVIDCRNSAVFTID